MDSIVISSAKNPAIKHLRKLLGSGKHRREQGLAVAEGAHLAEALLSSPYEVRSFVYCESSQANPEVAELIDRLTASGSEGLMLKDSLFETLSDIHAAVGMMAIFGLPDVKDRALSSSALLLEDIQDPGNLGTILRTAAAAGIDQVYLSPGTASPWSPKTLRAGMGAQFGLNIFQDVDLLPLVEASKVPVIATSLTAEMTLYEADLSQDIAWVFGNEGQGVSPELLAACSYQVRIPQADSSVESLNVAASAAVCLFEQHRQRMQAA